MRTGVIIVAGGQGVRAGGGLPKQYRALGGKPVLARTLAAFRDHPAIGPIMVVIASDAQSLFDSAIPPAAQDIRTCFGGETRTQSVRAGLVALSDQDLDCVLIHDAARPFLSHALIDRIIQQLGKTDGALPALPIADALCRIDGSGNMADPVDRTGLFAAQTPQGFRFKPIEKAYADLGDLPLPDDAAVAARAGLSVAQIEGEADNFKITTPADFARAERLVEARMTIVTGQGFDVHRLEAAPSMTLCGVDIHDGLGLVGHSDADVALHAITDAILGTIGAGDIGQHFPPSDAQWRGAASSAFVRHALSLLEDAGGQLVHADLTIIGERPKIGPYRDAMRSSLAEMLSLPPQRVNIKATTTEKLGFTGRGEGLAAQALVTARIGDV